MLINNFTLTMQAYTIVTSSWTRLYFITFIVFSVYVFLNMFTGFILDSFLRAYQAIDSRAAFVRSLQQKIDKAASFMREKQWEEDGELDETPPQRWRARFNDSLLDFYMDLFHSTAGDANPFDSF